VITLIVIVGKTANMISDKHVPGWYIPDGETNKIMKIEDFDPAWAANEILNLYKRMEEKWTSRS